jgi:hypothetical protein
MRSTWNKFDPTAPRRSGVFHMEQSAILRQNPSLRVLFHVKHLAS